MRYCILEKYKCGISLENNTAAELAATILTVKNMDADEYSEMCKNARMGAECFDFKILTGRLKNVLESVVA